MKLKEKDYNACIKTPFAKLGLRFEGGVLTSIDFIESNIECGTLSNHEQDTCKQIKDYCENKLPDMRFDVPVKLQGTAFQKKVWRQLQKIPSGELVTYGELARQLNSSARAVGNACRSNPVPVVVPCHRVVAKQHRGGYAGETSGRTLAIKNWLIDHEKVMRSS